MLESVRFKNFRAFEDTGQVELGALTVLIGANNAGKTSFLSAIELYLRSLRGSASPEGPFAFEQVPSFASFDSVLRRHWSRTEQRPHQFVLAYRWHGKSKSTIDSAFTCRGNSRDNTSYVHEATIKSAKRRITLKRGGEAQKARQSWIVRIGKERFTEASVYFQGPIPFAFERKKRARVLFEYDDAIHQRLEVVHPYRPVPRSFYVLDDPSLTPADRELLAYLIRLWTSDDDAVIKVRQRIVENLQSLGLVKTFSISSLSNSVGPRVFEIRVAPNSARQRVTIADAGFGLSQALPLATSDARLESGNLVVYQPEVHLHPFAQSRLADMFVRSANRGNQVFVETHSPDLILRLQTLIARKTIEGGKVRVLCVENVTGRSSVRSIQFNEQGSPTMAWPRGFLDTSLQISRELANERGKRLKRKRA